MIELVGREREEGRIAAALAAGRNVALTGKFGSGKTALMRHFAEAWSRERRFVFVDWSAPPREAWTALAAALAPRPTRKTVGRAVGYRTLRARALAAVEAAGPPPAVVFDDVDRLTAARLDLLRRLVVADRFRLVAILEGCLAAADRARLLALLAPVERIRLGPLPPAAVRSFLVRASSQRGLGWSADKLAAVACRTGGYPLAMRLAVEGGATEAPPG